MNNIQIGIACGKNCERYIEFLVFTIMKTVSNSNNIDFLLGINNNIVNINFLKNIFIKNNLNYKIIKYDLKKNTPNPSSYNHASCLNEMLKNMDKEYGMFIDCDVVLLEKNWDVKLIEMFHDNIAIIGGEYDGKKYKNFPNVIFCIFKTNILKKCDINFLPFARSNSYYSEQKYNKIIQENEKYFNATSKPIVLDVGWELPVKLQKNNFAGITMKIVTPRRKDTHTYLKFMLKNMRGESYQINNIPFCNHVGRSSSRSFDCDIVKKWSKRTLEWLNIN